MGKRGPQPKPTNGNGKNGNGKLPAKNKGGRPEKPIDTEAVLKLASIQCTAEEIAAFIGFSKGGFSKRLERDKELGNLIKEARAKGRMSLRRAQYSRAINDKNTTMQIWLGKQWLDQKDSPQIQMNTGDAPIQIVFQDAGQPEAVKELEGEDGD